MVLFFVDDMAYGDLGATGAPSTLTPNIDRLAARGRRLSGWYSGASICSPSRASLMTGRHFVRTGVYPGAWPCNSPTGMSLEERTLGDVMKDAGYRTGFIGKWHLGQRPQYLPTRRGFDTYLGVPYSIDMGSLADFTYKWPQACPYIPLLANETVVEQPADLHTLTRQYTEAATEFVRHAAGSGDPFMLVLAHSHVHVSIEGTRQWSGPEWTGTQRRGRFGDAVAETDWSVGEVMRALEEEGLAEDTLVLFTSDNGPWMQQQENCGSEGPFRGMWGILEDGYWDTGKGSTWEGGFRVPAFAAWPGVIPPGTVSQQPLSTMDILPTFAHLANAKLPDAPLDGHNIMHVLEHGDGGEDVWPAMPLWRQRPPVDIGALRKGPLKFHFATQSGFLNEPVKYYDPPLVFDVDADPGEQWPLDLETSRELLVQVRLAKEDALLLNETIERHPPLQVGGDRRWAVCQKERFEDCFPPVPTEPCEDCNGGLVPDHSVVAFDQNMQPVPQAS